MRYNWQASCAIVNSMAVNTGMYHSGYKISLLHSQSLISTPLTNNYVHPIESFHVTSQSHEEVQMILLVYRLNAESVLQNGTCKLHSKPGFDGFTSRCYVWNVKHTGCIVSDFPGQVPICWYTRWQSCTAELCRMTSFFIMGWKCSIYTQMSCWSECC